MKSVTINQAIKRLKDLKNKIGGESKLKVYVLQSGHDEYPVLEMNPVKGAEPFVEVLIDAKLSPSLQELQDMLTHARSIEALINGAITNSNRSFKDCGQHLYENGNLVAVCTQKRFTEHDHSDLSISEMVEKGLATYVFTSKIPKKKSK